MFKFIMGLKGSKHKTGEQSSTSDIAAENKHSKTCVRQSSWKLTLVVDVERWLSYKGTCHVISLAKLHDMYLYKTGNFFHINHYLSQSRRWLSYTGFTVIFAVLKFGSFIGI